MNYLDRQVVIDGSLVTSRRPRDIPAFMRAIFRITKLSRRNRGKTVYGSAYGVDLTHAARRRAATASKKG